MDQLPSNSRPSSAAGDSEGESKRLSATAGHGQPLGNLGFIDENSFKNAIQHPGSAIEHSANRRRPFSSSSIRMEPDTPLQQQETRNDQSNDGRRADIPDIADDHSSFLAHTPISESRLPMTPDNTNTAREESQTGISSSGAGQGYLSYRLPPGVDTSNLKFYSPDHQKPKPTQEEGTSTAPSGYEPPKAPAYAFGPHIMSEKALPADPKYLQSIYRPSDPEPEPEKAYWRPEGDVPRDQFNEYVEIKEKALKQARLNELRRFQETAKLKREHANQVSVLQNEISRYRKIAARSPKTGRGELRKPIPVADIFHQRQDRQIRRGREDIADDEARPFRICLKNEPLYDNVRDRLCEMSVNAWLIRAKLAYMTKDWQAMERYSEQARQLATFLNWGPFEAKCTFSKGIALYKLKDYVTAYECFEEVDNAMEGYYISQKKICYWLKRTGEALAQWSNPVPIQLLRPQPRHDRDQFPLQYGNPVSTASPPLSGASPRISSNRNTVQPHTAPSNSQQAANSDAGRSPIEDLALDESHVQDSHRRELAEAQNAEAADSRILNDHRSESAEMEEAVAAVFRSFYAQRERRMQEADPERTQAQTGADRLTTEEEREADAGTDDGDSQSSYDSRVAQRGDYELRDRQRRKEKAAEEARQSRKCSIPSDTESESDPGSPPSPNTMTRRKRAIEELGWRRRKEDQIVKAETQKIRELATPIARSARTAITAGTMQAPWRTSVADRSAVRGLPSTFGRSRSLGLGGARGRAPGGSPLGQRQDQPREGGGQWRRSRIHFEDEASFDQQLAERVTKELAMRRERKRTRNEDGTVRGNVRDGDDDDGSEDGSEEGDDDDDEEDGSSSGDEEGEDEDEDEDGGEGAENDRQNQDAMEKAREYHARQMEVAEKLEREVREIEELAAL